MYELPISLTTQRIVAGLYADLKDKYIEHRKNAAENTWIQTYNLIKDPSWPDCASYKDFYLLDDWIQQECCQTHNFSPNTWVDAIGDDANMLFSVRDKIKINPDKLALMETQADVVKNKTIVDFACNFGTWSFWCSEQGARQITGVDARKENIDVANSIKQDHSKFSAVNFEFGDIHDYKNNANLCRNADVVLLLGVLYHVHDHFCILESVAQPNVQHIIIETEIYQSPGPEITWKIEPTFELISG